MSDNHRSPEGLPSAMTRLVRELAHLPGIGEKTATRLALVLLSWPRERVIELAESLLEMKERVGLCACCLGLSDSATCSVCADPKRDHALICVVETPADLLAIERSRSFTGVYHVLHGTLAPAQGIGPDDLKISQLVSRITNSPATSVREVIIATNATVEGDATALYLAKTLKPLAVKTTRIARGLPTGSDLEYSDAATLSAALSYRREL
jgi:recombination protein RecR